MAIGRSNALPLLAMSAGAYVTKTKEHLAGRDYGCYLPFTRR